MVDGPLRVLEDDKSPAERTIPSSSRRKFLVHVPVFPRLSERSLPRMRRTLGASWTSSGS